MRSKRIAVEIKLYREGEPKIKQPSSSLVIPLRIPVSRHAKADPNGEHRQGGAEGERAISGSELVKWLNIIDVYPVFSGIDLASHSWGTIRASLEESPANGISCKIP